MASATDPCSFSSFSKCVTKHLNLTYHVDFDSHVIKAKVALTVEVLVDNFTSLTLDTKDLKVSKVTANGQAAKFTLGPKHSFMGTPLEITLPFDLSRGQHVIVEVTYETAPSASALQWLTPEQTAGKKHPYLFSQCQATHCRSMVPCQDTPAMKHTYYAQVSVPKELVAVMSAVRDGQEPDPQDSSRVIYRFRQPVAMPSYLIAIVVGALESREIGPRSRVWSEKEFVDKAAFEFSETETMLKTAEDLAGPYVWGQYDILVLPPSFPYGGMENPCLTFATPTLLAGDRSLSNVIAHEISHSWTGNLVTNKTWEHFWLNEGHTVYLERMIGRSMESEQFRQFKAMGGWKDLQESRCFMGGLERWMHTLGLPPFKPQYDTTMADACIALCKRWVKTKEGDLGNFSEVDVKTLSTHQLIEFLSLLLQEEPLPLSHVKKMQEVYRLNAFNNAEIRFRWLRLCVKSKWEDAVPMALKMATEQGRMKFTRPLFKEVYNFDKYREEAVRVFIAHRAAMHPVTSNLVAKDLKVDTGKST
ncbi:leukotriene A-4 hydrolase [Salvelinus sp. IW2-2015]|uniref:leukotriene A-4 hydrolase n=1 Tax=Salvelinus sp. IW2-2015 TaxID=2691554 RepID=UPI0038D3E124